MPTRRIISLAVIYIPLVLGIYFCGALMVHAQTPAPGFAPLVDIKDSNKLQDLYQTGSKASLSTYINRLFFFMISLGGMIAVLQLARAGWLRMGGDNWGNIKQSQEIISNVIIGVLLLLSIWLILYQINPCILKLDILSSLNESSQQQNNCKQ